MENKFELLTKYILEWNEKINVTAIRDPEEFAQKNIGDSLSVKVCPEINSASRIMDLGTGGGFPGLPLALAYPEKEFFLVDSIGKKLRVAADTASKLGLSNVHVIRSRAEDLPKDILYDLVVSRAVAALPVLCEYALPFVKTGGFFIAYKTEDSRHEIEAAGRALKILGGKIAAVRSDEVPGSGHIFVVIEKISDTPAFYPRKAADIKRKPL